MALNIRKNVSLLQFNTFRVDAQAAYFVEINRLADLIKLRESDIWNKLPRLVLGGGSNVLFVDDFPGLVVKVNLKGISVVDNEDSVFVKAASGENWHELVEFTIERDFGGIENLSLIPGCVGAAPIQNIGAYGVELESCFVSLEALDLKSGEIVIFKKADCAFGYRNSVFKNKLKDQYVITSVTLKLSRSANVNIEYGAIRETLKKFETKKITIKEVSKAVIFIRKSKLPDPAQIGNAGSFFKNPIIEKSLFSKLQFENPDIPFYPADDEKLKIPAGWLIENAGLKGYKKGNAGVHSKQALVIVNHGGASGREIFQLSEYVREVVKSKFGILLQREVNVIKNDAD